MSDLSSLSSHRSRDSPDRYDHFPVLVNVQATVNPDLRSVVRDVEDVLVQIEEQTGVEVRWTKRRYILLGSLEQISAAQAILDDALENSGAPNGSHEHQLELYDERLQSLQYQNQNHFPNRARGLSLPANGPRIPKGRGAIMKERHAEIKQEYEKLRVGDDQLKEKLHTATGEDQDLVYAEYQNTGPELLHNGESGERKPFGEANGDAAEEEKNQAAPKEVYGVQKYLMTSGYYNTPSTSEEEVDKKDTSRKPSAKPKNDVKQKSKAAGPSVKLSHTVEEKDKLPESKPNPVDVPEASKDIDRQEVEMSQSEAIEDDHFDREDGVKPFAEEIMVDEMPWLYMQQEFDKQLDIIKESFSVEIRTRTDKSSDCVTAVIVPVQKEKIDLNALFCAREEFANIYQHILLDCAQEICEVTREVPMPARKHACQVTMAKYHNIVLRESPPNSGRYLFIGPSQMAKHARHLFMKDIGMAPRRQQVVSNSAAHGGQVTEEQLQQFLLQQQFEEMSKSQLSDAPTDQPPMRNNLDYLDEDLHYANAATPKKKNPVLKLYQPTEEKEIGKVNDVQDDLNLDDLPPLESITPVNEKFGYFAENDQGPPPLESITPERKKLGFFVDNETDAIEDFGLLPPPDEEMLNPVDFNDANKNQGGSTAAVFVDEESDFEAKVIAAEEDFKGFYESKVAKEKSTAAIVVEEDSHSYTQLLPQTTDVNKPQDTAGMLSVRPQIEVLDSLSTNGDHDEVPNDDISYGNEDTEDVDETISESGTLPIRKQVVEWEDDSSDEEDAKMNPRSKTNGMPDVLPEPTTPRQAARASQSVSPEKIVEDLRTGGEYTSQKLVEAMSRVCEADSNKRLSGAQNFPEESDDEETGEGERRGLKFDQTIQKDGTVVNTCRSSIICANCVEEARSLGKLGCGHEFCKRCIRNPFRMSGDMCPKCGKKFIRESLQQPEDGKMSHLVDKMAKLPNFPKKGSMMINFDFPAGDIMGGREIKPYKKVKITTYLPNNSDGRIIFKKLHSAFKDRKLFEVMYVKGVNGVVVLRSGITVKQDKAAITKEYMSKLSKDLSLLSA